MTHEHDEDPERRRRLDEAIGAYFEAVDAGQAPDPQAWLSRHPDLDPELADFFADQEQFRAWVVPLRAAGSADEAGLAEAPTQDRGETTSPPTEPQEPGPAPNGDPGTSSPRDHDAEADLLDVSTLHYFGDYALLKKLGGGGMGVVFQARQLSLNRPVAVKMIRAGQFASEAERQRFQLEAEAVADLDHPHIVPIYEVGEHRGYPYFSMKLIAGGSLEKRLSAYVADPRAAARLMIVVARAVHHVHQRGILHRDLKPANILVDADGQPHVTDFGLAKRIAGDSELTESGASVGTPAYMAPEQASGRKGAVTTATDVYGLGTVLYALLSGRPPFPSESAPETLELVRERAPEPPSQLNSRVVRDLEIICLACLEKEPRRRYASAEALAEDLERWLKGEPITARPVPAWERAVKWVRRRPAIAALSGAVVVVAVLGLAGVLWQWRVALTALEGEKAARHQANRAALESRTLAAGLVLDRGHELLGRGQGVEGLAWLARALREAPAEAADLRRAIRADLAAWWPALPALRAHLGHAGTTWAVAVSPDGKWVLTGGANAKAQIWDAATDPPVGTPLTGHGGTILAAAFAPDGRTALTAGTDGTTRLWDVATGRPVRVIQAGSPVGAAAFAPDGATVATGCDDGRVQSWDAATGQRRGPALEHPGSLRALAFGPDGRTLATACRGDPLVRLWDPRADGLDGKPQELKHPGEVHAVAISPDGRFILAGCANNRAYLWDRASRQRIGAPLEHRNWVVGVAFAPDGRHALTCGYDDRAWLWEVPSCRPIGLPVRHPANLTAVAFGPGGLSFATAALDGSVRVWDVPRGPAMVAPLEHPGRLVALAFGPDNRSLATGVIAQERGRVAFGSLDASTGRPLVVSRTLPEEATKAVAFGPKGRLVATSHGDTGIGLWDATTGRPIRSISTERTVLSLAFDPARRAILAGMWGRVQLWDVDSGAPRGGPLEYPGEKINVGVTSVAFGPDGRWALTGTNDHRVRLWELDSRRLHWEFTGSNGEILALAFRPDGRVVAAGGRDGYVRLWDAASGALLCDPLRHQGEVWSVAFSSDGRTLVVGEDGAARLWDVATGRPLGPPLPHRGKVTAAVFRPDGLMVATGDEEAARLWQVADPTAEDIDRIVLRAKVLTGLEVDNGGTLHALDAATWEARRRLLDALGGPPSQGDRPQDRRD